MWLQNKDIKKTVKEDVLMKSIVRSLIVVAILALFALPAHAADINLSVAASLREVATELCDTFAKNNPDIKFLNNFGGSGALAKQIENGAPADLFFSANAEWMAYLKERKLIDEKNVVTFAYNVLVFAGKPGLKVSRLQDVVKLNKIAIGSPASVPCGQYTMEAFKNAGLEKQLEGKLIMAKDVRESLLYAERGEADGAFVYKTDVEEIARNVKILFVVPQEYYSRVTYPVGLTIAGSKKAEAVAFFKFLQSAEAKAVLVKHGFPVK
jgi:molybdate transport system substrate-binding protein